MCRNLHGFSVRWVAVVALLVASVACGSSGSSDDPQGALLSPMIETDSGVIQGAHGGGDDGVDVGEAPLAVVAPASDWLRGCGHLAPQQCVVQHLSGVDEQIGSIEIHGTGRLSLDALVFSRSDPRAGRQRRAVAGGRWLQRGHRQCDSDVLRSNKFRKYSYL